MKLTTIIIALSVVVLFLILMMSNGKAEVTASVSVAPYRHNDLLWENDRTAHRIYGKVLEAVEPPSGSGIDAWGKNVDTPFMEKLLTSGINYHEGQGEGLDFYNVGTSRGAGGIGIWYDNKLWTSRNYTTHRILTNGPDEVLFEADYAPWPVDVVRSVSETREFYLPSGTNFTRMTSTISSSSPEPLTVAIGIGKKPVDLTVTDIRIDEEAGVMAAWGPETEHGAMGIAVRADTSIIEGFVQDTDNFLMLVTVMPDEPFSWCMGATWSESGDFASREEWEDYVFGEAPEHCSAGE